MTTAFYQDMIQYATRVLPYYSHLEPADLVGDAYISIGANDIIAFKKKIKSLAYTELNYAMIHTRFTSFTEMKTKQHALIETTRRCKVCGQDKGFHCFPLTGANSLFYRTTCKACIAAKVRAKYQNNPTYAEQHKKTSLEYSQKRKNDPVRYALFLEQRKQWRENNRDRIKAAKKAYRAKLQADPVWAEERRLKRQGVPLKDPIRHFDFSNDPIWETVKNNPQERSKYLHKKRQERAWVKLREDPVRHAAYLKIQQEKRRKNGAKPRDFSNVSPPEARKQYREKVLADPIKCVDFKAKNAAYRKEYMARIKADPALYQAHLEKQRGYQQKWLNKKNTPAELPETPTDAYQDYVDQQRRRLQPTSENSWQAIRAKIKIIAPQR